MSEILHQLTVSASPTAVFDALTTPAGLAAWWTTDVQAEPREGSTAEFGFRKHAVFFKMQVELLAPGERVVWRCVDGHPEWVDTVVTFTLTPTTDRTQLNLAHTGWASNEGILAKCSFDWARYLLSLMDYLETGVGRPHRS